MQIGGLVVNGGVVKFTPDLLPSTVAELYVAGNATIDLGYNTLSVGYLPGKDPDQSIAASVAAGYDGGNWDHAGIISSATADNRATSFSDH